MRHRILGIVFIALLTAALVFVPYPLKMDAKGQFLPRERRWVYTPVAGQVLSFRVEPGKRFQLSKIDPRDQSAFPDREAAEKKSKDDAKAINVLQDRAAMAELAELGVRSVPIIRRGTDWANGQVLRDVARVAGIRWGGAPMLAPAELVNRLTVIQSGAQRYLRQIPEQRLGDMLPNRPRSYGQLVYHIFNIADAFLEHETQGLPLIEGAYNRVQAPGTDVGAAASSGA